VKRLNDIAAKSLNRPACNPNLWLLDPGITFLNHGSFGACPRAVLKFQHALQARLERQPVQFLVREVEGLLDETRRELARFVNAGADDLVLVPNATSGVNTVLRSLRFKRGDELLVTDHEYNATRNALDFVAEQSGARVVVARVPFPLRSADEITGAILPCVTPHTRLALLDHVTSQTGLILPVERLVRELSRQGVQTLVDGAHAPGMIPVDLKKLGATYYTGNCHKWMCAPKSAAFLHVEPAQQKFIRPLAISHGANSSRTDRSRFQLEFGWTGTGDPTPCLSVPTAIQYIGSRLPGGWTAVRQRNHALAVAARKIICDALEIEAPCPDELIGSLAAIPLAATPARRRPKPPLFLDPLQDALLLEHGIEVPVIPWPAPPERCLRLAAQLYNSLPQYERLAGALRKALRSPQSK
jgi:isopenicillin-N epimerase